MADTALSQLAQLSSTPASADELLVVDKSDTSMGAGGTDKRIQWTTINGAVTFPTSALEVWVDYTNGDDADSGLSPGQAMKTISAAVTALITASSGAGSDANGRRGIGRVHLLPGDHDIGAGLTLDSRYQVEIVGTRSGRVNHDNSPSTARIVSTSAAPTFFIKITHATAIGLGFVFRDLSFVLDQTVSTSVTKIIYAVKIGHMVVDNCSFDTADNSTNVSVTAVYHEDITTSAGEGGWVRVTNNNVSRMQLYQNTTGSTGGNFNRGRIRDNVILYGGSLAAVNLNADTNGYLVDGNNFEGTATGLKIGPNGAYTNNTFLNNSGEDPSTGTPPNPFYDVAASCSQQQFLGGVCTTGAASGAGTWIHFNHASAYNNIVVGHYELGGTATTQKRKIVDDSTANGNVILHTNWRLAAKYKSGAGATVSDSDFVTSNGNPPNGTYAVAYDSTSGLSSLWVRGNGTWQQVNSRTVSTDAIWDTKGDLAVATGADAASKLAIGSNNQVLTADSGQTTGVKWAAVPSGTGAVVTDTIWDTKGDLAVGTGADTAVKLAAGTNFTHRLVPNSSATTGLAWLPHVVRRSSDSSARNSGNTGSTLTNDDTLLWAIAASEVWYWQAWLILTAANATMDSKFGFSVPTGTTMVWGGIGTAGSGVSGYGVPAVATSVTAMNAETQALVAGSGASNNLFGVGLAGTAVASSTAGSVTLQWAQNTADAGNLIMKVNSVLILWRLA